MCAFAPAGEVGGITTILVMPVKPVTVGAVAVDAGREAGVAHRGVREFPPPSTTGVAAMLEPAPTWQVSHEAVVGTWFDGSPTTREVRRRDRETSRRAAVGTGRSSRSCSGA